MFRGHAKQDPCWTFGASSALFPIAERRDADPHEFRELVLREAIGAPNLLRIGLSRPEHSAGGSFAASNFATLPHALEQFVEYVRLHFSSLSATCRSCFNWSALKLSRSCLRNTKSIKDLLTLGKPPIDHPRAAPFPTTTANPAQFSKSSTTWNHRSGTWRGDQRCLQRAVLVVGQRLEDTLREDRGLNDDHAKLYAIGA